MKQLTCPGNGLRDISEFQNMGPLRGTNAETPETVVQHAFYVENPLGPMVEWWRHSPSNTIFLAERHTTTDTILRTWLPDGSEDKNV